MLVGLNLNSDAVMLTLVVRFAAGATAADLAGAGALGRPRDPWG